MLVLLGALHRLTGTGAVGHNLLVAVGVVVLAPAFAAPALGAGGAVLGVGLAVAATLAANLAVFRRRREAG
ncbi:hypothetical protein GCM10018980_77150 [Streptomyces capoamus]|uniref:Uncharacterized protein n=1 Tax=Streptomyces capoamus TaxID=68183 RepID=A0A919F437_9ACTN|nr:hypothetical protein GCM10018980_77150 [Streptomyces capoamus]